MELTINVTKSCIERGKRGDCDACPIALATLKAFRRAGINATASVDGGGIESRRVLRSGRISERIYTLKTTHPTQHKIDSFMEDFDVHQKARPFRFTVKVPKGLAA